MTEQVPDAVVADAAREIVARAAPQEMPLFRATSEAYFADPEKALAENKPKDEMLGFGIEAAALLLTPVIIDVVRRVAIALVNSAGDAVEKEGSEAVGGFVHKLFQRGKGKGEAAAEGEATDDVPDLSEEQLKEVREIAYSRALELDVPEDRAGLLADAVVGSLATD
jgi:hypothetical protein